MKLKDILINEAPKKDEKIEISVSDITKTFSKNKDGNDFSKDDNTSIID